MKIHRIWEIIVKNGIGELTKEELEQSNKGRDKVSDILGKLNLIREGHNILYPESFGSDIEHLAFVNFMLNNFIGLERELVEEDHILKITIKKDETTIEREDIPPIQAGTVPRGQESDVAKEVRKHLVGSMMKPCGCVERNGKVQIPCDLHKM